MKMCFHLQKSVYVYQIQQVEGKCINDFHEYLHRYKCVCSINVCVCVCVKEGVFLEDKRMLVGACQALEGSVAVRISVAFVRIYFHNKDLVGDTWAGCVYIKESSQHGAAAMHQETLLLLCGRAGRKLDLMFCLFLKGKTKSRQCWVHASVWFMLCIYRCKVL